MCIHGWVGGWGKDVPGVRTALGDSRFRGVVGRIVVPVGGKR